MSGSDSDALTVSLFLSRKRASKTELGKAPTFALLPNLPDEPISLCSTKCPPCTNFLVYALFWLWLELGSLSLRSLGLIDVPNRGAPAVPHLPVHVGWLMGTDRSDWYDFFKASAAFAAILVASRSAILFSGLLAPSILSWSRAERTPAPSSRSFRIWASPEPFWSPFSSFSVMASALGLDLFFSEIFAWLLSLISPSRSFSFLFSSIQVLALQSPDIFSVTSETSISVPRVAKISPVSVPSAYSSPSVNKSDRSLALKYLFCRGSCRTLSVRKCLYTCRW